MNQRTVHPHSVKCTAADAKAMKANKDVANQPTVKSSRLRGKVRPSSGETSGSFSSDKNAPVQKRQGVRQRNFDLQQGKKDDTDMKSFVDLKTREEREKLLKAVYADDEEEEVKKLVRKDGYNPNFVDEADPLQPTPLIIAAQNGSLRTVKYLLRGKPHAAHVNAENRIGQRAIWFAALKGDAELAELLISDCKDKCEVNYVDKQSGMSPLYRAILTKAPTVCSALIHAGADVNMRRLGLHGDSSEAETPLIKAVQLGSLGVCEVLVNSLVDLQAKTVSGFTALHYAVAYRRYKITRYLLTERIKINARARQGITAMTLAVLEDLPAMVEILMEYGYSIDRKYQWGETPLEMALRVHAEECALVMLNWGCSWRRKDATPTKDSYFYTACHEGLCTVVKYLIELHPHFLQESWLKEGCQPAALYNQQEFYHQLLELSSSPFSLRELCRSKILCVLGKYPINKVNKLTLPDSTKEYLKLEGYFSGQRTKRKYREKSLFTRECPFDCSSVCLRPQCPDIEFSDSASEFEGFTESEAESEEGEF